MEKLLVLGASIAQVPFVKEAKKLGIYVGIVDYNDQATAIEFADEYFQASLLDFTALDEIVKEFKPNGITCGASDIAVENCAKLCKQYNLPGLDLDVAVNVKDKEKMIKKFEEYGVEHPFYQVLDNDTIEHLEIPFPVIIKPTDKSGSRGINVARNEQELKAGLQNSFEVSDVKKVIIEEYMDGPEVSVEVLVQDGEPYIIQVTDKLTTGEPHFIEIGHSQPSQLNPSDVEKIKDLAYRATKAVGVIDGCCHAEIKLTSKGPKMVEIAGRMGGDFITTVLTPISTGVNISKYEILRAIGKPEKFEKKENPNRSAAVRFIETMQGTVNSVDVNYDSEHMVGVEEIKVVCKSNKVYKEAKNNNDRFGYVIASAKTPEIAIERCENIIKNIKITMSKLTQVK